jgi:hypothetical protein
MIKVEFFTYSDEQWNAIKEQVLDDLGVDVDTIPHQVTSTLGKHSITGTLSLRDRIELAVSKYRVQSDSNRQRPRRADLDTLREDAKKLRASIIDALAAQISPKCDDVAVLFLRAGIDADMVDATNDYFRRLLRNLDRQIEQAGSSGDNARKTARHQCWTDLLAIWCELGGKPSGRAAARFLLVASKPLMGAVKNETVVKWLERRQKKIVSKVAKRVQGRRATR